MIDLEEMKMISHYAQFLKHTIGIFSTIYPKILTITILLINFVISLNSMIEVYDNICYALCATILYFAIV